MKKKTPVRINPLVQAGAKVRRREGRWQNVYSAAQLVFRPADHPKEATPRGGVAMDSNTFLASGAAWGARNIESSMLLEGQAFLGYPTLAIMAQRTENRAIVNILSTEMTRKWVKIISKGKDRSKAKKIAEITDRMKDLHVRRAFKKCAEGDGYFGRGHLFLQFQNGDWDDKEEIKTPVGDGRDPVSQGKCSPQNPLVAVKYVEAVWTYPIDYNTTNPLRDDWFRPSTWMVMGTTVHATRLLRFVMNEVPDMLKPAYSFGGLSMTQMARPYVDNWLKTRQATADLVRQFTLRVLATNLKATLQGGTDESLYDRAELLTDMESNNGVVMLDKDTEQVTQISAPIGGLHELQSQAQEHMSLPGRIPTVKLSGISPTGLNASSDGELEAFDDTIASMQTALFDDPLRTIVGFVQLSLYDEVDDDIDFEYVPLMEERPLERAQRRLVEAQYHGAYVEMGAIDGPTVRQALAEDPDGPYPGLEDSEEPDPWNELAESFAPDPSEEGWKKFLGQDDSLSFDQLVGLAEFGAMDDTEFEKLHPRAEGGKFSSVAKVTMKGPPAQGEAHEHAGGYTIKSKAFLKSMGATKQGPYHQLVNLMLHKVGGLTSASALTAAYGGSANVKAMLQHMNDVGKVLQAGGGEHGLQLVKAKGPDGEAYYGLRKWGAPKKESPKVTEEKFQALEAFLKEEAATPVESAAPTKPKLKLDPPLVIDFLKKLSNEKDPATIGEMVQEFKKKLPKIVMPAEYISVMTAAMKYADMSEAQTTAREAGLKAGEGSFFQEATQARLLDLKTELSKVEKGGSPTSAEPTSPKPKVKLKLDPPSVIDFLKKLSDEKDPAIIGEMVQELKEKLPKIVMPPEFNPVMNAALKYAGAQTPSKLLNLKTELSQVDEDRIPKNSEFESKHERDALGQFKAGLPKYDWKKVSGQQGSNPGGVYQDAEGEKHYAKFYKNPQQGRSEVLASKIYGITGGSLNAKSAIVDGKEAVTSDWNSDLNPFKPSDKMKYIFKLGKLYATAVALNDWDVLGIDGANIQIDKENLTVVQVDAGAAFTFRAQGEPKPYTDDINSYKLDGNKAAMFKDLLGDEDFISGLGVALNYMKNQIKEKDFTSAGLKDSGKLYETFKNRVNKIEDKFKAPLKEQHDKFHEAMEAVDPTAPAETANKEMLDFAEGLSKEKDPALLNKMTSEFQKKWSDWSPYLVVMPTKQIQIMNATKAYADASATQSTAKAAGLKESHPVAYATLHKATQEKLSTLTTTLNNPESSESKSGSKPSLVPPDLEERLKGQSFVSFIAKHGEKEARALIAMGEHGTEPGKAEHYAEKAKQKGFNLTPTQAWTLKSYTSNGYTVNDEIRNNQITPPRYVFMRKLNQALDKLPKVSGTFYRNTSLTKEQLDVYQVGMVVEEHSFTSTSKKQGVFHGNTHYTIKGKTGRDVDWMSSFKSEAETLFKSGTRFLVHSKEFKNGKTFLVLEDVNDDEFGEDSRLSFDDSEFEHLHPRAKGGEFSSVPGSGPSSEETPKKKLDHKDDLSDLEKDYSGRPDPKDKRFVPFIAKYGEKEAQDLLSLGKYATRPATAESFVKKSAKYGFDLTPTQAWSLKWYTDAGYFVNEQLRDGKITPEGQLFTEKVNQALDRLPKFAGSSYRATSLTDEQLDAYKVGSVVTEKAFTSSSRYYPEEGRFVGGGTENTVRYEIIGKTGRDVNWMSTHKSQKEILFKSGTRYMVRSKKHIFGKITRIVLEEVDDD